jgi:hypothetical protein
MRWAIMFSAYSLSSCMDRVGEVRAMRRIGWSAGLTLRKVGGVGMSLGSWRSTREIATCTSWAAASMLRSRLNCSVIWAEP